MPLKRWIFGSVMATMVAWPIIPAHADGETVAVNFVSLTIPFLIIPDGHPELG